MQSRELVHAWQSALTYMQQALCGFALSVWQFPLIAKAMKSIGRPRRAPGAAAYAKLTSRRIRYVAA